MLTPFLVIGCLLAAEPADDAALKTEVPKLVRRLNDDSKEMRTKAKVRLIELGPAVLDLLPAPDPQASDDFAKSVREIREKLQKVQAAASLDASTVALHGRMKISKALAEIQKQTGNKIVDLPRAADAPIPDPEIAVNFEKTPFWTALDAVLDQAQLSIYPYGQPGALQIVPRGPNDLPRTGRAVLQGPLRIEPVRVVAKRELRISSPPTLQIFLEVAWEPRLQLIAIQQRMADLKVLDSKGGSMAVEDPQAVKEAFPNLGSSAVEMEVALATPAQPQNVIASIPVQTNAPVMGLPSMPTQPPKEISLLKGSLRAMMLGKVETFRFADVLKGKQEKRIAAATVSLDEVRKNGDSWEVFVRLHYDDAGDALESHRTWAQQNEAYLEDAPGKPIQPDTTETFERTKTEIGVGYVFALPELPKNATFVYKTPGMVLTKDFPYEVRGVKMP